MSHSIPGLDHLKGFLGGHHQQHHDQGGNAGAGQGLKTVAYFVNWAIYARNHNPKDLPADYLTHILYAFGNVRPESGEVYLSDPWSDTDKHYEGDSWNDVGTNLYGCMGQLFQVKKAHRHLKVLLSIGGWTYSSNFAQPASTEAGRKRFASSAVQLLENLGIDGIDIDWEYPQNEEQAGHYVALLKEVRAALDAAAHKRRQPGSTHFLLTVACPAGAENFQRLKIPEMDQYLDFWNLMAYDYAGSWSQTAGHQANLYASVDRPASTACSTAAAVDHYTSPTRGRVHASKMVLGMPLYGRAFANTDGPGTAFDGVGDAGSWETGIWDFKALPRPAARELHDARVCASWSYDAATRTLVSYDSAPAVAQKAAFVRQRGLGGAMWWESSADRPVGHGSLIEAFVRAAAAPLDQSPNCLDYPESKYDNLRKQIP